VLTVTLYVKEDCHLCTEVVNVLGKLKEEFPHRLVILDVEKEDLTQKYGDKVPVVEIGPYTIKAPVNKKTLRMTLGAAQDRADHLGNINDKAHQKRVERGKNISTADRFFYWFSNHYMWVFNFFVFLYVGLAFLAPILMNSGLERSAGVIYTIYRRFCHQLSFRSWFLFGEQIAYPRALANVRGLMTYAEATGFNPVNLEQAQSFLGNAMLGYKTALCQRDVAIYGSILLFGLIFSLAKKKFKSIPFWAWVVFGMVPIGLDGVSQLISQLPFDLFTYRESTPFLRTLTGGLFGFTTAWFGYPLVEETMEDTRNIMAKKIAAVKSRKQ
jgi:uncharacterized membrane protein